MTNAAQVAVISFGGIFLVWSVYKYLKKETKIPKHKFFNRKNQSKFINEVLFFPDENVGCKNYFSSRFGCQYGDRCKYSHEATSLRKLCYYVESARVSLDVCLYVLSNEDLMNSIVYAMKNGARVRLMVDSTMADSERNRLTELNRKGVILLLAETRFCMHHKFAIVDNSLLITGSFNWSAQAPNLNCDNAMITNNAKLVVPFITEFEKMWKLFSCPQGPQEIAAFEEKLKKYPFLNQSAWTNIIVGHQAPNVVH